MLASERSPADYDKRVRAVGSEPRPRPDAQGEDRLPEEGRGGCVVEREGFWDSGTGAVSSIQAVCICGLEFIGKFEKGRDKKDWVL